ncbi:MAG: copper amine oxidase N-terminal domain-containing protein, partial [Clostridia bacterium]|nr:copper amine oxidase N-terminal domain-containing protein [Clostridia bacterium]
MVTPVADEIGVFEVKANKGKIAVINGEQVLNGKVTLEAGETEVTWVDGQQEEPIEIKLTIDSKEIVKNGEKSELDVPAQIVEGRTLVPLRAIFEALGASVEWNGETST